MEKSDWQTLRTPFFISRLCRLRGVKVSVEEGTGYDPASTPQPTPAFRCPGFCMEMPAVLGTVTGPWLANQPFTVPDYTDWIRVEGK